MAIFRNTIFRKEDFQKLVGEYEEFETLLNGLNEMFVQLHTMLGGGLTFGDNVSAEIRTIAVAQQQKFPMTVAHKLGRLPQGVIILRVTDQTSQGGGSKTGSGSKNAYTGTASPSTQQSVACSFTPQVDSINIDSFGAIDPTHKYSIVIMIV